MQGANIWYWPDPAPDGRWRRGGVIAAFYAADSEETDLGPVGARHPADAGAAARPVVQRKVLTPTTSLTSTRPLQLVQPLRAGQQITPARIDVLELRVRVCPPWVT